MATVVKLVKHYLKNGKISLFIEYYPYFYDSRKGKTIRSENLQLFMFAKPENPTQKKHNADMEELALAIQSKRIIQIRNGEFGFLDSGRRDEDFLAYLEEIANERMNSNAKWTGLIRHFRNFCHGKCTVGMLNVDFCKRFSDYLQKDVRNRRTGKPLNQNTASGYITTFRVALKKAYVDKLLDTNLNDFFNPIPTLPTDRGYLTYDEFVRLANTPILSKYDVLKRASIFAVFSGLRYSDLWSLTWGNIVKAPDGGWCIHKEIQKTRRIESIYISEEALSWCGQRSTGRVFSGLSKSMTGTPFKKWLKDAGIEKDNFSFHCLRHTAATLMYEKDIDVYTVSKMLTHRNVQTTQIYADVVDKKKREAANSITLKDI